MSGFASSGRSRHPRPPGAGRRRRPSALDSTHISPTPARGRPSTIETAPILSSLAHAYQKWYLTKREACVKRLPAVFYRLASGREPVREWLKALGDDDRKIMGEDIKDVEFSWPIGMPLCRPLGKGLWEVRSE